MKVKKRRDIHKYNSTFAAKHPNVFRRSYGTWVEGERSSTIPHEGVKNILFKEL